MKYVKKPIVVEAFEFGKGVFLPITKEQLLSALYEIGGTIKARADYKDQAWNLVQELIEMVENGK